jgi:hypothetical protein
MNKITILLTTTVNVQNHKCYLYQTKKEDRLNTYLKSVVNWLDNTLFNIVLVENSGYDFNELNSFLKKYNNRFEIITFCEEKIEDAKFLKDNCSKGASEIFAINYAYNKSNLLNNSSFIIKVTGRYFIPELQNFLSNFDINVYDVLTQYDPDKCEIVGCHNKHFKTIFDNNLTDETGNYIGHVEFVYKYRCSLYKNVIRCLPFHIEPTQRGGTPEIYNII